MSLPPLSIDRKVVLANYRQEGIAASPSYFLLIDLDNEGGVYKHTYSSGSYIRIVGFHGTVAKSIATDQWVVFAGVVLSIDAVQSTVGWTRLGTIGLRDTSKMQDDVTILPSFTTPLEVVSGDLTRIATTFKETSVVLNTGTPIPDVGGVSRVAAPGDLILKAERVSGAGTALFHYLYWYFVE